MVPYVTLRLRLFPHLRWGFANYSINILAFSVNTDSGRKSGATKKADQVTSPS